MNRYITGFLTFCLGIALVSCGGSSDTEEKEQYDQPQASINMTTFLQGKELYLARCATCHQPNGQGMASVYPPLAGSDYMQTHKQRLACIIKHGLEGKIEVNGKTYKVAMPANEDLNTVEIADILTYINNAWEDKDGITYTDKMVLDQLNNCVTD